MISFRVVDSENKEEQKGKFKKELGADLTESISEIIDSFISHGEEDVEYAFSYFSGCALVRIFDFGRYLFAFPYEIAKNADICKAVDAVFEYAIKEGLRVEFTDVPSESLRAFKGYRHLTLDAENPDADVYRIKIHTECSMLDEIPELVGERVTLNALTYEDIPLYAQLAKDENVNKYWGYDYKMDNPNPSDEYFFETANVEFKSGIALSFAIRYGGKFAGEAQMYAFDGKGGAEFAIRLLPDFCGKGIASCVRELLCEFASSVGMSCLKAQILKENKPSIAFVEKAMTLQEENEGVVRYIKYL